MWVRAFNLSTADIVAFERAWHQRFSRPVIVDPFARDLCGSFLGFAARYRPLTRFVNAFVLGGIVPASMGVVMRARYAERQLEAALARGACQYVIIGAGMDSFAFRRADLMGRIALYEIDHPAEQRKKLDRMRRAGLEVAPQHHFVAADLSQVSVSDALRASTFDDSKPAFLSLLGVACYLTPESLGRTLRSVASATSAGTRIVLDYLFEKGPSDSHSCRVRNDLLRLVKRCGEPMRSAYSFDSMNDLVQRSGLEPIEHIALADLEDRYRAELGTLPLATPDLFGIGTFEVPARVACARPTGLSDGSEPRAIGTCACR